MDRNKELIDILDLIDKEYKKALKENRNDVDGYSHSYALIKSVIKKSEFKDSIPSSRHQEDGQDLINKKRMNNKQIAKIYKKRETAYKTLLECDIAIDKLLKKLINK